MSYTKISQADARRFRKERDEARQALTSLLSRSTRTYTGVHIGWEGGITDLTRTRIKTAQLLGHAVFVQPIADDGRLNFNAIRP